jgi:Class II Aldolase and Adducin N-terminal domain
MLARATSIVLLAFLASTHFTAAQAPVSGGPVDSQLIEELVAASRILADQGVLDAYGHVSIRHPANPNRYLVSRAMSPADVTAADIMEFDLDSNPVDQRGRSVFLERFIHGEIYKARPDVNAVIHSHSPGVIPFGITNVPLRPVMHTAAFLYVGVPVFEIRDAGGTTDLLVRRRARESTCDHAREQAGRVDARARQCRRRAERQAGDHTGRVHRGERAPADDRARARRTDQLCLTRGGRTARQEPGRRRSRLGRLEGQGDAEIEEGSPAEQRCLECTGDRRLALARSDGVADHGDLLPGLRGLAELVAGRAAGAVVEPVAERRP